jgi:DNA-binding response OmpR family regulator
MPPRTIRLLHVEDDPFQQKVIAHHLQCIEELRFHVTCASNEDQAIAEFRRQPSDFVIIDYHLSQGDGLSCLRTLRQQDPIVPIVAVSGQASEEIAAALLRSGADDYISKCDLHGDLLAGSIRMALRRADAWRRRKPVSAESGRDRARAALLKVCKGFTTSAGSDFLHRLAECETAVEEINLTGEQLDKLFEVVCLELTAACPTDRFSVRQFLRPIRLELQLRLARDGGHFPENFKGAADDGDHLDR